MHSQGHSVEQRNGMHRPSDTIALRHAESPTSILPKSTSPPSDSQDPMHYKFSMGKEEKRRLGPNPGTVRLGFAERFAARKSSENTWKVDVDVPAGLDAV